MTKRSVTDYMKRKANSKLLIASIIVIFLLLVSQATALASSLSKERKVPTQYFMNNPEGYNASMWELVRLAMENWEKELGVPFEMEVLDHDQLNAKGLFGGEFDVRIQYFSGIPARLDPGFMLYSRFYATCENYYPRIPKEKCPGGGGPFNSMGYYSLEFNKLMEQQSSVFDYKERKKIIDRAIEMTVADRPVLVLFAPHMLHLMNTKSWQDEKPTVGEGLSSFWNTIGIKPKGNDKTLKIGSIYTVPTLNPVSVMTAQGYRPNRLIYDRLMRIDPTGKPTNWMAEKISISDGPNGPQTVIEIKIREDMKFHDDKPVTAEDVKFTFDFAKKYNAPDLVQYLKRVKNVEQKDKYTVQVNLESPWSAIGHVLFSRMLIIPKHIWEKVPEQTKNPVEWANPKPVGSGPFKFGSWERASQLVLNKNPDYFHPVEPDRLVRVRFETNELLAASIERGEIDVQWGEPMQPAIAIRAEKVKNVKIIKAPNHGHMVFDLRIDKPPYSDPAFRKALEYCLPRKKMIEQLYYGFADEALSTLPPGNKAWHNPNVSKFAVEYNPEKGRQVLKEAGYEWDDKGQLYYPPK